MNIRVHLIKIDADVDRTWVAVLSNEQIDNLMHTKPSEEELANFSNDADVIIKIARNKVKDLMAEEVNRIYAKRT